MNNLNLSICTERQKFKTNKFSIKKQRLKHGLLVLLLSLSYGAGFSQCAPQGLINYPFNGNTSSSVTAGSGLVSTTTAPFNAANGVATTGTAFFANVTAGGCVQTSVGAGGNVNFDFTITGSNLVLYKTFSIYFQTQRTTGFLTGNHTLTLSYNKNGTGFVTFTGSASTVTSTYNAITASLPVGADNPTTSLIIRLNSANINFASSTFRVDNFQVKGLPNPLAPTTTNASICNGAAATIIATVAAAPNFNWYPVSSGGSSLSSNTSYSPINGDLTVPLAYSNVVPGVYTYYAEANLLGCITTRTPATVTVGVPVNVGVTASSTTVCSGSNVTLNANITNGSAPFVIDWTPATFLSSTNNATTTAIGISAATTYIVNVTDACSSTTSGSVTINVNTLPVVSVNSTPSPALICTSGSVSLNAGGANTYSWSPATGLSATNGGTITASPAVSTVYTVTGTDLNGCTSTQTTGVLVSPAISMDVSALPALVCPGGTSNLSAAASNSSSYSLSSIPFGFVSTTSFASVSLGNNAMSGAISLPFNFSFYGQNYTNLFIGSNGFVQFGASSASTGVFGQTLPNAANPNNIIAGVWADLRPSSGGTIKYGVTGTAPDRIFTIEFNGVPFTDALFTSLGVATFQIQLYETMQKVEVHVQTVTTSVFPSASVTTLAIKNNNGTSFVAPAGRFNNGNWNVSTPEAWRFSPSAGSYNYSWNPATFLSSSTISNPVAQNVVLSTVYTVTASDVNTCTATQTLTVSVADTMISSVSALPSGNVCQGTIVTIQANPSLGKTPYTYLWNTGATTASVSPTVAVTSTYLVTVSDLCGTVIVDSVTIPVIPLPVISVSPNGTINVCSPGVSQVLTASSNAVTPSYQWKKDGLFIPGETNSTYTVTVNGSYAVLISDNSTTPACSIESLPSVVSFYNSPSVSLTSSVSSGCLGLPAQLTSISSNGIHVLTGSNNTSASISASGTPTVSRTIVLGSGNLQAAGDITVTVNLSHSWVGDLKATLTGPCGSTVLFDRPGVPATGTGNSNDLNGQYVFSINAAGGLSETGACPAGTYKPSDVNGNSHDFLGITFPCLNVAGTWTLTIEDLASGDGGILSSWSISVNEENYTTTFSGPANIGIPTMSGIHNSIANVQVSPSVAGLNTYTVTTSDINGCTATVSATVDIKPLPIAYIFPHDSTLCISGFLNVYARDSGAYSGGWPVGTTFSWDGNPPMVNDSVFQLIGDFNYPFFEPLIVSLPLSLGGCSDTAVVPNIAFRERPFLTLVSDSITCGGLSTGIVKASVQNGAAPYRYKYYNSLGVLIRDTIRSQESDTLFSVPAGTYSVIVYDTVTGSYPPPSCSSDSNSVIVGQQDPILVTQANPGIDCHGNNTTVTINASGGTPPYSGVGAFTQFAGSQTYTVTDTHGCISQVVTDIQEPPALTLALSTSHIPCSYVAENIASLVNGGTPPYLYSWSNGATTSTQSGLTDAQTYTVTVTDSHNCTVSSSVLITPPGPVNITGAVTNMVCRGIATGSIATTTAGGVLSFTYLWNNGNTNMNRSGLGIGAYTVTVTDINGCTNQKTYGITQPATSILINTAITNVRCYGLSSGVATVAPSGGSAPYSYSWNTFPVKTTATINGLLAGVYTCAITDAIGCIKTINLTITQPADINILQTQSNVTFPGGNNGTATVTVSGGVPGYNYSWNTVPSKTTATVTGLTSGTYKCTISDSKSCTKKVTFVITEPIAKADEAVKVTEEWEIKEYPNPSSGMVMLSFENPERESFRVTLSDYTGRLLFNKTDQTEAGLNEFIYDFTAYAKGVYFIRIATENKYKVIRIVIQ